MVTDQNSGFLQRRASAGRGQEGALWMARNVSCLDQGGPVGHVCMHTYNVGTLLYVIFILFYQVLKYYW